MKAINMKCLMIAVAIGLMSGAASQAAAKPPKVFVLAGQSNMQGQAKVTTFEHSGKNLNTAALPLSPLAAPAAEDKPGAAPIPTFDPLELDR